MLVHIVAWKYKETTSPEKRDEHLSKLRALPGSIPEIISFEVGTDILKLERSFHTGLVAKFADRDALDAYTNHPDHLAVAAMGKEIAQQVISVDFLF